MIRISLDAEFEQPRTNIQTPDSYLDEQRLIEIGWTIFESTPFTVIKQQSYYINIGVPLSAFIKKLTGATDEKIAAGKTLLEVYDILVQDMKQYKATRIVAQWGSGDMESIAQELQTSGAAFKWEFGRSGLNVKHLYQTYCEANGLKPNGGLASSMAKLGVVWQGRNKHRAGVDALNTAYFYSFLMQKMKLSIQE